MDNIKQLEQELTDFLDRNKLWKDQVQLNEAMEDMATEDRLTYLADLIRYNLLDLKVELDRLLVLLEGK